MSDPRFEHDLQRMFADAPRRPDADLFAAEVRLRLDRSWTLRRIMIGLAGVLGGVVAVWQMAGVQVMERLQSVARLPVSDLWNNGIAATGASALRALPIPMEVVWLCGGLMLLAAGMLVTRVVDEF